MLQKSTVVRSLEAEPALILLISSLCTGLAARPVINVDAQVRALLDLPDILSQTSAVQPSSHHLCCYHMQEQICAPSPEHH